MRLLLDAHLLLWKLGDPDRLDDVARDLVQEPTNEVLFSAAGIWKLSIKAGLGRADFSVRPKAVARAAQRAADQAESATYVAGLPPHHRDPFDRLIVAQARSSRFRHTPSTRSCRPIRNW